jgi:ferredoxin
LIEVRVNGDCQAWGQCIFDAPDVFDLKDGDRETWRYVVSDDKLLQVTQAAKNCPNAAISLVTDYEG